MLGINDFELKDAIKKWLIEDMPYGDLTSDAIFDKQIGEGKLLAKERGVLCGLEVFQKIYQIIDSSVTIEMKKVDGDVIDQGEIIGLVKGPMVSILKGERLGLNLLQHLSGIATMARAYCNEVKEYSVRVADTRKTTPGLRQLEKYAVVTGGASNHRFSLSDGVMIKDNHISGAGSIAEAVRKVRDGIPHTVKIEVETETLDEVEEAVEADVDIIMLDNMSDATIAEAVCLIRRNKRNILIEASGNMNIERMAQVASLGVDIISIGNLTHSVSALDISLKFEKSKPFTQE